MNSDLERAARPARKALAVLAAELGEQSSDTALALAIIEQMLTDIETGLRSGMCSILVMSGETTEAMLAESPTVPDLKFGRLSDMIPLL